VELILDGGILRSEMSSVISLVDDVPEVIRAGKGDVSEFQ
jgi:tRNA A37 threonylcarbamoyladenosine synthetase subunit TsaC/SUA5/YrdC